MIKDLRFIERDGEKVLQREVVTVNEWGVWIKWEDVPLVSEEEDEIS